MPYASQREAERADVGWFLDTVPTGAASEHAADDATRVYLALVRLPHPTRELLLAQGIPAARLDPALATLAAQGLITLGAGGAFEVPPPLATIPQYAGALERRAGTARAAAEELSQLYYAVRAHEPDPAVGVRVLQTLEDLAAATNQAVALAQRTIRSLLAMTDRSRDVIRAPLLSHREPSVGADGRVVAMQTVWDSSVLKEPGAVEALAARDAGGEAQRFLAGLPISVIVVDHTTCIVEWSRDDPGPQGLLGHSPGAVTAGLRLFERFWDLATPMGRASSGVDLDTRDATVLRLMAAGVADAGIARQTGLSQRTVERRVRHLMDRLGAQTRFQAGVLAVHREWL